MLKLPIWPSGVLASFLPLARQPYQVRRISVDEWATLADSTRRTSTRRRSHTGRTYGQHELIVDYKSVIGKSHDQHDQRT